MVVVEVLALLVVAAVMITGLVSIGRPVAELITRRVSYKLDALGSDAEQQLKARVAALEEEVRSLRMQVIETKEATEFAVKMIEKREANSEGQNINLSSKQSQSQ